MAEEQAQPQLALERIYVKDMSLEVPGADVFTKEWNPELDINLSSNAEKLDDDHYQATLTVSVKAKNAEAPAFIAEVHQAGIFLLKDIPEEESPKEYCITIAFINPDFKEGSPDIELIGDRLLNLDKESQMIALDFLREGYDKLQEIMDK